MSFIDTTIDDGVAVLTVDDPQRRNALSAGLCAELVEAFERFEGDSTVGAVVITGAGPAFCAGADLSELGASREEGLAAIYSGFLAVARSSLPTIAAVNGAAVGAGMNLALACDVRIAGRSARFDTRFLDLGIHPGGGHTWMLRNAIGQQGALAMVLFGEQLDGDGALRAGLVWDSVDDDSLLERATTMARRAASGPPELARRIKASVQAMRGVLDHGVAVERELVDQLWSMDQPAFAERLSALQARISDR